MAYLPPSAYAAEVGGPDGHSYGAVIVVAGDDALPALTAALRGIRFSGWVTAAPEGCIVAVGDPGAGVVASQRRGILDVGGALAALLEVPVFAVQVRRDRQLALVAWRAGEEVGRYCSDPSLEPGAARDVRAEPFGADGAEAFADAAGRTEVAEELQEALDEELDTDSVFESERLRGVLRLLVLPDWIVAASALPRDIPTGPRAAQFQRLRVGATGIAGIARQPFVRRVRRGWTPPPVIADPPTDRIDETWMF